MYYWVLVPLRVGPIHRVALQARARIGWAVQRLLVGHRNFRHRIRTSSTGLLGTSNRPFPVRHLELSFPLSVQPINCCHGARRQSPWHIPPSSPVGLPLPTWSSSTCALALGRRARLWSRIHTLLSPKLLPHRTSPLLGGSQHAMGGFKPGAVPIYASLTVDFTVLDHWIFPEPTSTQPITGSFTRRRSRPHRRPATDRRRPDPTHQHDR
jgi:hypothetical protein